LADVARRLINFKIFYENLLIAFVLFCASLTTLWDGGKRIDFCGSTGLQWRSMYLFKVSVFLSSVVWGVSPTTCGSAPFARCNPRFLRSADTAFAFITSHTV
jgi:hypothetical protein